MKKTTSPTPAAMKASHPVLRHLTPVSNKRSFDEAIKAFFVDYLHYDSIQRDPNDPNPDRADAWRLVYPDGKSLPFAVAYDKGLSNKKRKDVGRLYVRAVQDRFERATSPRPPVLYIFTDGERYVFFSADPFRNRDDRFDLGPHTIGFASTQNKLIDLPRTALRFTERLGTKRPAIDFLFKATALSQDEHFKAYAHQIREELLRAALNDKRALAQAVYHLLDKGAVTRDGRLKKSVEELYLEYGQGLGDALAGAVDTLLLRLMLMRFVEAYYGEMPGLRSVRNLLFDGGVQPTILQLGGGMFANALDDLDETQRHLAEVIDKALNPDASRAKSKKNVEYRQLDLFVATAQLGKELGVEEEQRKVRLGGDFYLSELAEAATAIEQIFLAKPKSAGARALTDFLGRTAEDTKWEFRYEDLRPQTLQDYYEQALGTAVQITLNKRSQELELAVTRSQRAQKELGAYYTDARLCRFMVEQAVKPLLEERLAALMKAIKAKDAAAADAALQKIIGMRVCDPTMGSAPFLRSAFDYFAEQYVTIVAAIAPAQELLPDLWKRWCKDWPFLTVNTTPDEKGAGKWEWHVLRRMLYGVDIDLKAVCIASQTFALSSLRYLPEGERFPSFFSVNLKRGNALINPLKPSERGKLAEKHGKAIAKAIRLRRIAATTKDYAELSEVTQQFDQLIRPIADELIAENVVPFTGDETGDLRPFCWELEFPEVFFTGDGTLRDDAGFDCTIGNPPWEGVKVNDEDFFKVFDPEYPASSDKAQIKEHWLSQKVIAANYERYKAAIAAQRQFFGQSGHYNLQGRMGLNQLNLYKLSVERFAQLTSAAGRFCIIVLGGILCDSSCSELRRHLLNECQLHAVRGLMTSNEVFPTIHKNMPVAVLSVQRGGTTQTFDVVVGLESFDGLYTVKPTPLTLNEVKTLHPQLLAIPLITSPKDRDLILSWESYPKLGDPMGPWKIKSGIELFENNSTSEMREQKKVGPPILRGAMIFPYELDPNAGNQFYLKQRYAKDFPRLQEYRLVHRDANDITWVLLWNCEHRCSF